MYIKQYTNESGRGNKKNRLEQEGTHATDAREPEEGERERKKGRKRDDESREKLHNTI